MPTTTHGVGSSPMLMHHLPDHRSGQMPIQEPGLQIVSCFDLGDSDPNCDNPGAGTVSLTFGSSTSNLGDGVNVYAKGAITVKDFYTTGNQVDGYNVVQYRCCLTCPNHDHQLRSMVEWNPNRRIRLRHVHQGHCYPDRPDRKWELLERTEY